MKKVIYIINAGGKATRMGPWAPAPKPCLGIGPWAEDDEEGQGPSCLWRWLYWLHCFQRRVENVPEAAFSASTVIGVGQRMSPELMGYVWQIMLAFPNVWLVPDTAHDMGSLGTVLALADLDTHIIMFNGDDLLAGPSIVQFLLEAYHRLSDDKPQSLLAVAQSVEQKYEFGAVVQGQGGLRVLEKLHDGTSDVGCGMLALHASHVRVLAEKQFKTSSGLINNLPPDAVRAFPVQAKDWHTLTDPARYMAACSDPKWQDSAYQEWKALYAPVANR